VDFDQIERVTDLIYESATQDDGWQLVTDSLSDLFGGATLVIDHHATSGGECPMLATTHFDDSLRDLHFEEYRTPADNPGVAALLRAPVGVPFSLASFIDPQSLERDPATRALLYAQRIDKGFLVALDRDGGSLSYMNVLRRRHQPDFDAHEEKVLAFFVRHIARSLELARAAARLRNRRCAASLRSKAGWTTDGLMLLDHRCRVVDADAGALAILEHGNGLCMVREMLISNSRVPGQGTEELHHFIRSSRGRDRPFVVAGDDGAISVVDVLPTLHEPHAGLPGNVRYVTVRHLRPDQPCQVAAFGPAYGLTKGELRALDALSRVPTVTAAAASLGLSRDTMKTHLSQIYAKTQCNSLAELMRLVGRFQ
jgi:DNA-binding CsgD family transcriptional regulator